MGATAAVHPTDQMLRSFGLGGLDDASAESVNKHLEGCAACQRRVAEMSSDRFLVRLRDAHGQPSSTGPFDASLAGLSMLEGGANVKAPPPASTLPPGLANHPDYEVIRELGHGGVGTVYLALNRLMDRHEVLKVVSRHMMNRPGVLDRFLVEIRDAARLHHTNVVTAYSATRIGESVVFAMEYVDGLDPSKLVKAKGALPISNACNYVHQAALGLQHASDLGMVHRDIKPSNLMLAKQGNRGVIKVLDFGLAKVRSEGAVDGGLTHEGQMLGTPDYVAPEQISDARRADIRADIYSLGCTLYDLLTGGPPFQATSLYEILQAHHAKDARPVNLARPEVPVQLAALVARMMAKKPERRFQTPKDVAQALTPFFTKGNLAFQSPEGEVSHAGQAGSGRPMPGVVSAPSQPATKDAGPTAEGQRVAKPSDSETEWNSRVDLGEMERARDQTPAIGPTWRPPWLWPSVAVGVLLLALSVAWAVVAVKRGMPPAYPPSLRKGPGLSPLAPTTSTKSEFQPLFNGKDLAGWKSHPKQPGNWHVAHGVLIGSGPALSHLYTERGDCTDFHLRVEARFNEGGSSGVYLRCPFGPSMPSSDDPKWPNGFEATINNARIVHNSTGGLYPGVGNEVFIADLGQVTTVPFREWFTLEVIADGSALAVLVNGKPSAYKFAPKRLHPSGHIALQQYSAETVIEFRKIDIEELNRSSQKDSKEIGRVLSNTDRVARVDFSPDGLGILSGELAFEITRRTDGRNWVYFGGYALRLWAVASGRNLYTMRGEGGFVRALALSSDGRYATSSDGPLHEQPILIWDLETGQHIHRFTIKDKTNKMGCTALSFSSDDRRVMAASTNGDVLVWDLATEQEQPQSPSIRDRSVRVSSGSRHSLPIDSIWSPGPEQGRLNCGTCKPARDWRGSAATRERFAMWPVPRTDGSSFPPGATTPSAYGTWPPGMKSSNCRATTGR